MEMRYGGRKEKYFDVIRIRRNNIIFLLAVQRADPVRTQLLLPAPHFPRERGRAMPADLLAPPFALELVHNLMQDRIVVIYGSLEHIIIIMVYS